MKQMIEILKKQLEIYKEILKISEDKTDIIVKDKVEELKPMVEREETLVEGYIALEKERIGIIKAFADSKGISKLLRIDDLCEYFPDDADEMKSLKEEILDVTRKIKIKNATNQELVKNSLEFLNFSIGLIAGTNRGTGTYGKEGNSLDSEARNFFDLSL
jgi:flagellar biosynthesis/type III secretory pathway chaperone